MQLIDGKAIAEKINEETKRKTEDLKRHGVTPGLAVVLVGTDPASVSYVSSKDRISQDLGLHSKKIELAEQTTESDLLQIVKELNADSQIHGILVQSPLPKQIDESKITLALDPAKDVDGFHPINVGKLSMLVGKPLAFLLMAKGPGGDATVTVVHSRSRDLVEICASAEILIAAMGQPGFVKKEHVREGAIVIDVGTTRVEDPTRKKGFRLAGDVDFDEVAPKTRAITPVPGGVGPMTIAMLMQNTLKACQQQTGLFV